MELNKIHNIDCLEGMKELPDNSVDLIVTDPPYGYSFMGKDWDKAVPSVEIWKECLRVLKAGAFAFVMSSPRSDVQCEMITRIKNAGFRVDFTPIYWTYATGFPKATNIGKMVDKKLGNKREITGKDNSFGRHDSEVYELNKQGLKPKNEWYKHDKPATEQAKELDGSYAGFQPKPAVEVIIVAMKPLSEKTYVEQAMKNGKGITWLDDCRVPTEDKVIWKGSRGFGNSNNDYREGMAKPFFKLNNKGRFPANLLVSDDVLNENKFSRFFDLDKWAKTYPFLIVPKASKSEKNKGCDTLDEKNSASSEFRPNHLEKANNGETGNPYGRWKKLRNNHPTVKPLKLMSYLITLGSRPNDIILDPFIGSGTTGIASQHLNRKYIGYELNKEYCEIANKRIMR